MSDLTLPHLLALNPDQLHNLPGGWAAMAGVLTESADDYTRVTRVLPEVWSRGDAAAAAAGKLAGLRDEIDAAHPAARVISLALEDYAHGITALRRRALTLIAEAEESGYGIDQSTGRITAPEPVAGETRGMRRPVMAARNLLESFAAIVTEARTLDDAVAKRITDASPDQSGVIRRAGGGALLDRDTVAAYKGKDPKAVSTWWKTLTPEQRGYAIAAYPDLVGWLDGVPAQDRDQSNRITLRLQHDQLETERQSLLDRQDRLHHRTGAPTPAEQYDLEHPDLLQGRITQIDKTLSALQLISDRLDHPAPGQPQAYLLGFNAYDAPTGDHYNDHGRAILAIGDPDAAGNVATYVPGTFARLDPNLGDASPGIADDISRVDVMAKDAAGMSPGMSTSVIMWVGYDAPQRFPDAMSSTYADNAAPDLRRFEDGLRVTHDGPPAHQTIIGHSYGTTVIGHAATSGYLNVDDIVLVASPGIGVDHAYDLNFGDRNHLAGSPLNNPNDAHVWSTTAQHDIIGRVEAPRQIGHDIGQGLISALGGPAGPDYPNNQYLINGRNPANETFGGRIFTSDPGVGSEAAVHSEYWDDGTASRDNMARIILGDYGRVR